MDQIVHTLTGVATARLKPFQKVRHGVLLAIIAANAPDLDVLTRLMGGALSYLSARRTFTHSLLSGDLILFLYFFLKTLHKPGSTVTALIALNWGIHILMDLTTTWPTYLFWPFLKTGLHLDWQFILGIPLWFVGVVYILFDARFREHRHALATLFLIVTTLYFLHAGWTHELALRAFAFHHPTTSRTSAWTQRPMSAVPLPFSHHHRLLIHYRGNRVYRYLYTGPRTPPVPLRIYDLSPCPNPDLWKNQFRESRIFFRFADTPACFRFTNQPYSLYFNARFDYTDVLIKTFPWLKNRVSSRLPFVLKVRFSSRTPVTVHYIRQVILPSIPANVHPPSSTHLH